MQHCENNVRHSERLIFTQLSETARYFQLFSSQAEQAPDPLLFAINNTKKEATKYLVVSPWNELKVKGQIGCLNNDKATICFLSSVL